MAATSMGRRVCQRQIVISWMTKSGSLDFSKPPLYRRMKMYLLYDGFFLLPSCGRFISIIELSCVVTHNS